MKVLKIILIIIASLIALFVIIGFLLPSKSIVERNTTIKAPDYVVFELIDSLKNFNKWSPWNKYDTTMIVTYNEIGSGKGASLSWKSNKKEVGKGKMTITVSKPFSYIECSLNFMDKYIAKNYFKIEPQGKDLKVTMGMETDYGGNIIARYFGLFMDAMIGKDFDEGLVNLKKMSEAAVPNSVNLNLSVETMPEQYFYSIPDSSAWDTKLIQEKFTKNYTEIISFLVKNGYNPHEKPPVAITDRFDKDLWVFEAGLQVPNSNIKPTGRIKASVIPAGKVLKTVYFGSYDKSEPAYNYIFQYINGNGFKINGRSWEAYVNDPLNTPPDKLETDIYFPIIEAGKSK